MLRCGWEWCGEGCMKCGAWYEMVWENGRMGRDWIDMKLVEMILVWWQWKEESSCEV